METLPKISIKMPKIARPIVNENVPVLVKFPEVVAGILAFLVGVAEIVAIFPVIVADGVATKAGNPAVLSAAKTVKFRVIVWNTLFASVYSKVRVCTPGSRPCGGVHFQTPSIPALITCVISIAE